MVLLHPAPMLDDPSLIERLTANLLDNVVRHNTVGGTIQLTTGQRDDRAVISVANTGPLIPPAEISRVFQPFECIATPRASNGNGHGLGLSIFAAIAEVHGAEVTAHARHEGSLRIQVSFPVWQQPAADDLNPSPSKIPTRWPGPGTCPTRLRRRPQNWLIRAPKTRNKLIMPQAPSRRSGGTTNDQFGSSVAFSGSTAMVGAYGRNGEAGATYVFGNV